MSDPETTVDAQVGSTRRIALPEGVGSVGIGLVLLGITIYVYLITASHLLGKKDYAPLGVLWTTVFLVTPGFFNPIEQELSRAIASRRARGDGARPLVRLAVLASAGMVVALILVAIALFSILTSKLFSGKSVVTVVLLFSIVSYSVTFLMRGVLSGHHRFATYGWLLGGEGLLRVCGVAVLIAVSSPSAESLAVLIPFAPAVVVAVVIWKERHLLEDGSPASMPELGRALGWLLGASVLAQTVLNSPILLVRLLSASHQTGTVTEYTQAALLSRVPLFLFQAVQAALLPRLARYYALGDHNEFVAVLRRLLGAVLALGIAASVGGWLIGPFVLRVALGGNFELGHRDVGMLATGGACYLIAIALAQALIAISQHRAALLGWLVASITLAITVGLAHDLLWRCELSAVTSSLAGAAAMGVQLRRRMHDMGGAVSLDDADVPAVVLAD